jgi:hypothetical protein
MVRKYLVVYDITKEESEHYGNVPSKGDLVLDGKKFGSDKEAFCGNEEKRSKCHQVHGRWTFPKNFVD